MTPKETAGASLFVLLLPLAADAQIPDRLSLVRLPASAFDSPTSSTAAAPALEWTDVFTRGAFGNKANPFPDYRWPHVARIPGASTGGRSDTLLALASACNATKPCSSAHPWPCCSDTDEQMLVLRRSVDAGKTFSGLIYPYLQPNGAAAWPFPPNVKSGGQLVWDSHRKIVWLFFSWSQAHDGAGHGCVGDGQSPQGLLLSSSTDFGLSFSTPFNLSTAIAPTWTSLCVAPSGGNAALDLGGGELRFMANVVGSIPGITPGELLIHAAAGGAKAEDMTFTMTSNLLRPCSDPATGKKCDFDEAALAHVAGGSGGGGGNDDHLFAVLRSDPALTHTYATAHSVDGGTNWGPVTFAANLSSVACQPSAVAVPTTAPQRVRLYVAAPQLGGKQPLPSPAAREQMTVMVSDDAGLTFPRERALMVYAGPSMYSNLADGGGGDVLLFFERAGNTSNKQA